MNSEISSIKNKLKKLIEDKDILDVILFGSSIKGKASPNDFDIAVISEKEINLEMENFHFSFLKPIDFFKKRSVILTALFKEGYSVKFNMSFSELYDFKNKVLFKYDLKNMPPSKKVKVVNILRGNKNERGMVENNKGEWLANQVFFIPVFHDYIFEKFFLNFSVKYKKYYILMH